MTKLDQIVIRDCQATHGWINYNDQHGNTLLTLYPDEDRGDSKLSFDAEARDIVPMAAALHDTYILDHKSAHYIAAAVALEFEASGY